MESRMVHRATYSILMGIRVARFILDNLQNNYKDMFKSIENEECVIHVPDISQINIFKSEKVSCFGLQNIWTISVS